MAINKDILEAEAFTQQVCSCKIPWAGDGRCDERRFHDEKIAALEARIEHLLSYADYQTDRGVKLYKLTGELEVEAERLRAALERAEAVAERWESFTVGDSKGNELAIRMGFVECGKHCAIELRSALAGTEAVCQECSKMDAELVGSELEGYPHDITTCACECHGAGTEAK